MSAISIQELEALSGELLPERAVLSAMGLFGAMGDGGYGGGDGGYGGGDGGHGGPGGHGGGDGGSSSSSSSSSSSAVAVVNGGGGGGGNAIVSSACQALEGHHGASLTCIPATTAVF
jgi:hypothetical protein